VNPERHAQLADAMEEGGAQPRDSYTTFNRWAQHSKNNGRPNSRFQKRDDKNVSKTPNFAVLVAH